jgi:putative PIN family toxin of toxin-antitoxin system
VRRVVVDSNVLISARLSPRGAPGRLLAAWLAGRFELIVSPVLLAELAGVLARPKFRRWLSVEEARAFVRVLHAEATLVEDPQAQQHPVRDPDDAYLLTLAQSAKADCLVSGDGDLTSLEDPDPLVLTTGEFLASLDVGE